MLANALHHARPLHITPKRELESNENSDKDPRMNKKRSKKKGYKTGKGKIRRKGKGRGGKGKGHSDIFSHPLMRGVPSNIKSSIKKAVNNPEISDYLCSFEHPLDMVADELEIAIEAVWADLKLQRRDGMRNMHAAVDGHRMHGDAQADLSDSSSSSSSETGSIGSSASATPDSDNESSEWDFADIDNHAGQGDMLDCTQHNAESLPGIGSGGEGPRALAVATARDGPVMLLPTNTAETEADTMSGKATCIAAMAYKPDGMQCTAAAVHDSQFSNWEGEPDEFVPHQHPEPDSERGSM